MRKRPLFERVKNFLDHYPEATRILVHPEYLDDLLLPGNCVSPHTKKMLPVVVLGTDIQITFQ